MDELDRIEIFKKACACRQFEERAYKEIENKRFSFPLYLSAGQEFIPATIAHFFEKQGVKPFIFAQHRAHSTFLSFGGKPEDLINKLLSSSEGSASIQCKEIKMLGHDGLMGSQIPIAVGACFSSKNPTLAIMGDASAEEDYVMSSIAWAGTHKLPIIFIVEDNNFSILTEKKVRRNWNMSAFARSVGVNSSEIEDDPILITEALEVLKYPILLNINTTRLFWHAGAGQDEYFKFDRYKKQKEISGRLGQFIEDETKNYINLLWDKALERQLEK